MPLWRLTLTPLTYGLRELFDIVPHIAMTSNQSPRAPAGTLVNPVLKHPFSHIQTIPSAEPQPENIPGQGHFVNVLKKPSYAEEIERMAANEYMDWMPAHTLATNYDGSTFAAKARAAELNASRSKQADQQAAERKTTAIRMRSSDPVPLSSYLVLKPRHARGRTSKTLKLPELPPNVHDENTPPVSSHSQAGEISSPPHLQQYEFDQDGKPHEGLNSSHSAQSRSQFLDPFPPLLPSADHPFCNLTSEFGFSPTTYLGTDCNIWNAIITEDFKVADSIGMPHRGGKKGASPGTPVSDGGKSRRPTSRPHSSNTKKSESFRDHLSTGQMSHSTSLNPNQQPFQPRTTPQRSKRASSEATPDTQVNTQPHRSAQMLAMDDPFKEQSQSDSSNYFNVSNAYNQFRHQSEHDQQNMPATYFQHSSHVQQSPYHHQPSYTQQPPYAQQGSYSQQSPYAHQTAHDQAGHGQTLYARPGYGDQNLAYPAQSLNQHSATNPRAAVRMPPPAVKGTPTYDSRLALLQSMANEQQMRAFYDSDPKFQQEFLDSEFGPQQTLNPMQQSTDQSKNLPQDLLAHVNARHTSQQSSIATSHLRDPAPYTGFGVGGSKKDMLLQNLDHVVQTSKAQRDPSGSTRTVLHDPIAHASANRSSSELTTSTVKAAGSSLHQPNPQDLSVTETNPLPPKGVRTSLEKSDRASSEQGLVDSFTNSLHSPLRHEGFTGSDGGQLDTLKNTQREMAETNDPHQEIAKFIEGGTTLPIKKARLPANDEIKYTVTGHPIPHGGFADFTTPYSVNFFGEPKDFQPSNDTSQAVGNAMIKSVAQDVPQCTGPDVSEGTEWFHSADRFRDLDAVAQDLGARTATLGLGGKNIHVQTPMTQISTPQGKSLLNPIGHERASASKSGGKSSSGSISQVVKDLMKNPSAKDGEDLMVGVLANFMSYADGSDVGDHFTRWARPGEWAIDRTIEGNKSFFGGGFEAAPQRVARDPRYQQTVTADGRATYFEDPGRGKSTRQWSMA